MNVFKPSRRCVSAVLSLRLHTYLERIVRDKEDCPYFRTLGSSRIWRGGLEFYHEYGIVSHGRGNLSRKSQECINVSRDTRR